MQERVGYLLSNLADRGAVVCSLLGDGTISNQWGFFVQSLEVEERIDGLLIKESQNEVLLL